MTPSAPDINSIDAPPAYNEIMSSRSSFSVDTSTIEEVGRRQSQRKARRKRKRTKICGVVLLTFAITLGVM